MMCGEPIPPMLEPVRPSGVRFAASACSATGAAPRCKTCGCEMEGLLSGLGVATIGEQVWFCVMHGTGRSPNVAVSDKAAPGGTP